MRASTPVEFLVLIIGTASVGTWWFGYVGGAIGFIFGFYLFMRLQKKKNMELDYNKIENLFKKYNK